MNKKTYNFSISIWLHEFIKLQEMTANCDAFQSCLRFS